MKLRHERRKRESGRKSSNWIITFSDLITLILVFFILLFSMSQIDLNKFKAAVGSFQDRADGESATEQTDRGRDQHAKKAADSQDDLLKKINDYIEKNQLSGLITAKRDERGVILVLQEAVLFDSGKADIKDQAYPLLHKIAVLLKTVSNPINVEGHTDNRPISTYRFPSNWELSAARASTVIGYFTEKEKLDSSRFLAVGYADTKPVRDNRTESHMKENRRVEIVISKLNTKK
ncbi:flagellar motor protein MotS [Bacillus swezeyi]|uniref:Flagellar motor protein MotS n=1 Tax=Bacillus swezeyi TaxID=1925020 RepID=A0A1R1QH15_9BACI|nr:flagellar motor protein MotS [Bacillus swezeyi]MEC1263046.1 flagellar motor protein MotS [Bacillus swezeyi]MED2930426.1 flagellar motor protein MotS [Bacillus swezeyi]MED2963968.1 flagellar motor protein MotS [Bacillus swezeyi]MED2975220.1 flagellar motor protein MotS [Bacillus swezeyi]MED3074537.1 flagellar motor protein MotS [Bacillus swezeyi]